MGTLIGLYCQRKKYAGRYKSGILGKLWVLLSLWTRISSTKNVKTFSPSLQFIDWQPIDRLGHPSCRVGQTSTALLTAGHSSKTSAHVWLDLQIFCLLFVFWRSKLGAKDNLQNVGSCAKSYSKAVLCRDIINKVVELCGERYLLITTFAIAEFLLMFMLISIWHTYQKSARAITHQMVG